jgi:hypothetical protein
MKSLIWCGQAAKLTIDCDSRTYACRLLQCNAVSPLRSYMTHTRNDCPYLARFHCFDRTSARFGIVSMVYCVKPPLLATAWLTGWCNSGKQPCRSLRTAMGSHSYISYTDSLVQRAVSHPHFLTWCGGHADMRQPHNPANPFLRGCDPPFRLTSIWYDVVGMKQWQPSTPIQCCSRTSNVSAFHCDPLCLLHPCATRAVVDMMI